MNKDYQIWLVYSIFKNLNTSEEKKTTKLIDQLLLKVDIDKDNFDDSIMKNFEYKEYYNLPPILLLEKVYSNLDNDLNDLLEYLGSIVDALSSLIKNKSLLEEEWRFLSMNVKDIKIKIKTKPKLKLTKNKRNYDIVIGELDSIRNINNELEEKIKVVKEFLSQYQKIKSSFLSKYRVQVEEFTTIGNFTQYSKDIAIDKAKMRLIHNQYISYLNNEIFNDYKLFSTVLKEYSKNLK